MFKLKAKLDAGSLPYMLSHFECDGHTVLMLTQQHLPPPLTTTVKLSLFMPCTFQPTVLTGYISVAQTVLVVVTMAGRFLDRPTM